MQNNRLSVFLNKQVGVTKVVKISGKVFKPKINLSFIENDMAKFETRLPDELYYAAYYYLWAYVTTQNYYDTYIRGKGIFNSDILKKYKAEALPFDVFVKTIGKLLAENAYEFGGLYTNRDKACLRALHYCYKLKRKRVLNICRNELLLDEDAINDILL